MPSGQIYLSYYYRSGFVNSCCTYQNKNTCPVKVECWLIVDLQPTRGSLLWERFEKAYKL